MNTLSIRKAEEKDIDVIHKILDMEPSNTTKKFRMTVRGLNNWL